MNTVRNIAWRIWRLVRWPLAAITLFLLVFFLYEFARVPGRTQATVEAIHSQKITAADVDGSNLPPTPDPALVDATVEGIDANENGIRDDVELAVHSRYADDVKIRAAALQYALSLQNYLLNVNNSDTWLAANEKKAMAYSCVFSSIEGTSLDRSQVSSFVESIQLNTEERKKRRSNSNTYATTFVAPKGSGCDLDI